MRQSRARESLRSLAIAILIAVGVTGPMVTAAVYRGAVLRPLAIPRPDEVLVIGGLPTPRRLADPVSYYMRGGAFAALCRYSRVEAALGEGRGARRVEVAQVTPGFGDVAGVGALIGVVPGTGLREAVLSFELFERLGGRADLIGSPVAIDGAQVTVAGVMPAGFSFPDNPDLWLVMDSRLDQALTGPSGGGVVGPAVWLGRLRPGARAPVARRSLAGLAALANAGSGLGGAGVRPPPKIAAVPATEIYGRYAQRALALAEGASLLLLVICMASVLALGIARAEADRVTNAVRQALGASRVHLVARGVARASAPAAVGGLLAALFSSYLLRLAAAGLSNPGIPDDAFRVGFGAWALAVGLCVAASALVAGLFTWRAVAGDPAPLLQAHGTAERGGRAAVGGWLVVLVSCTTSVLLVAAVACGLGLYAALNQPLGFDPGGVTAADVVLPVPGAAGVHRTEAAIAAANSLALGRIQGAVAATAALPGVASAAAATCVPADCKDISYVWAASSHWPGGFVGAIFVTEDYFKTMGIPVTLGSWRGRARGSIAVNESLWHLLSRGQAADPARVHLTIQQHGNLDLAVAAVVGNVRNTDFQVSDFPQIYVGMEQQFPMISLSGATVVLRSPRAAPTQAEIQAALGAVGLGVLANPAQPVSDLLRASLRPQELRWEWLEVAGGVCVLLAWISSFAVVAHGASGRRREYAVRAVCGASPGRLVAHMLLPVLRSSTAGTAGGILLWYLLRKPLGVELQAPVGALVPAAAALAVLSSVLGASVWPAWRAATSDAARDLRDA